MLNIAIIRIIKNKTPITEHNIFRNLSLCSFSLKLKKEKVDIVIEINIMK